MVGIPDSIPDNSRRNLRRYGVGVPKFRDYGKERELLPGE